MFALTHTGCTSPWSGETRVVALAAGGVHTMRACHPKGNCGSRDISMESLRSGKILLPDCCYIGRMI
jgi:hypothetical protein